MGSASSSGQIDAKVKKSVEFKGQQCLILFFFNLNRDQNRGVGSLPRKAVSGHVCVLVFVCACVSVTH